MAKKTPATTVPAPEVPPVAEVVVTQEPEAIDTEAPLIAQRKADGTLKAHLIRVVREYATKKIVDEEDARWAVVKTMTDADIWSIIEWCEYERGARTMTARAVNKRASEAV